MGVSGTAAPEPSQIGFYSLLVPDSVSLEGSSSGKIKRNCHALEWSARTVPNQTGAEPEPCPSRTGIKHLPKPMTN